MRDPRVYARALRVKQLEHEAKIAHYNRLLSYFRAAVWGRR